MSQYLYTASIVQPAFLKMLLRKLVGDHPRNKHSIGGVKFATIDTVRFYSTQLTLHSLRPIMRARIEDQIVFIHHDDVPEYKKGRSIVRNSYFWALKSIAAQAYRQRDWEYESEVWLALQRMLLSFAESGYLGLQETQLEFPPDLEIPPVLKPVSTWQ